MTEQRSTEYLLNPDASKVQRFAASLMHDRIGDRIGATVGVLVGSAASGAFMAAAVAAVFGARPAGFAAFGAIAAAITVIAWLNIIAARTDVVVAASMWFDSVELRRNVDDLLVLVDAASRGGDPVTARRLGWAAAARFAAAERAEGRAHSAHLAAAETLTAALRDLAVVATERSEAAGAAGAELTHAELALLTHAEMASAELRWQSAVTELGAAGPEHALRS